MCAHRARLKGLELVLGWVLGRQGSVVSLAGGHRELLGFSVVFLFSHSVVLRHFCSGWGFISSLRNGGDCARVPITLQAHVSGTAFEREYF